MKVVMTFDFNDDERERIIVYMREQYGKKGFPKRATREHIRDWINDAINSHWINVEDVESGIEERKQDYTD
jgi:hypothetical protein